MGVSDRVTVLDYGEKIAEGAPTGGPARPARDRGVPRDPGGGAVSAAAQARRGVILELDDVAHVLRLDPRAQGHLARGARGRDRDADRRERRGQVDDAALDQRAQPPAQGHDLVPRRGHHAGGPARRSSSWGSRSRPRAGKLFPRMTRRSRTSRWARSSATDRKGDPRGHGPRLRALPAARRAQEPEGGDDVGRRAADVRDRPRADGAGRSC